MGDSAGKRRLRNEPTPRGRKLPLGVAAIGADTLGQMSEPSDTAARLYLVTETGAAAPERLSAALAAAEVACVLIEPPADMPCDPTTALPLIALTQKADAAALLLDNAAMARELRADGVHISAGPDCLERYRAARDALGPQSIVGAHAGKSRHDAMVLGEADADYVAFGAPPTVQDREGAAARRLELVSWWAEIFEVPCVAMDVASSRDAAELAAAGADFIAVRLPLDMTPDQTGALVRSIHDAMVEANGRLTP